MITASEAKELVSKSDKTVDFFMDKLDKKIREVAILGLREVSTEVLEGLYYHKSLADFSSKSTEFKFIDNVLALIKPKLEGFGFGAVIKSEKKQYGRGLGFGINDDGCCDDDKEPVWYTSTYMLISWR
jgi:hypothetical protein